MERQRYDTPAELTRMLKEAMAAELISGFVSDMMRLGYTREQTIRLLEKKREG